MDDALSALIDSRGELNLKNRETLIEIENSATGEISLVGAKQSETFKLKPLGELYGPGNSGSPDPQNPTFMPLFIGIESEIVRFDKSQKRLTDADVSLALDAMGMSPEAPSADPLIQWLQCGLRLTLSLNDYSRQEVRQAIRRIGRSVARHQESGRGRGYLNFIDQFV